MLIDVQKYDRWQAFGYHLGLSLLIFLALLTIIIVSWYPGDLIHLGGYRGIKILAGIDLVLGPLLTLIVYNPKKKSLKFDLFIIALIQFGALSYGITLIKNERPIAIVLSYDGFHVLPQVETEVELFDIDSLKAFDDSFPTYAVLDLPNGLEDARQVEFLTSMTENLGLHQRTDLYRKVSDLNQIELYSSLFNIHKSDNCIVAPVKSRHLNHALDGCLSLSAPHTLTLKD